MQAFLRLNNAYPCLCKLHVQSTKAILYRAVIVLFLFFLKNLTIYYESGNLYSSINYPKSTDLFEATRKVYDLPN